MAELSPKEQNRRQRVVHGWRWEFTTREELQEIELYLRGSRQKPPARWQRIDEAMS